jgi:tetratricopeptide (TPR) repeat protein
VSAGHDLGSGSFGTILRRRRLALGLSQEELADRSGLSVRAIANMEQGRTTRPHRYSVQCLGYALGLSESERRHLDRVAHAPSDGSMQLPPNETMPVPVPRQLPPSVAGFVGRTDELRALTAISGHVSGAGGAAVISSVGGTAGVGKTALALHWAHQAADRFPDGQLYVNLQGYDFGRPLTAAQALSGFLTALGVPAAQMPAGEGQLAAMYRSLLAGRRLLVVLDNASHAEQVRPLLPGSSGCMALVTSRDSLAGLVARDGALRLTLDLLPRADAISLLRTLIGERVDAEPAAAEALTAQCCLLPLALRVAAELAAARPDARLTELVDELTGQQRLDLLIAGDDPRTTVRTVFSWSYHHLQPEAAEMFRLLGLHPGPDIPVPAAASLAGVDESGARRLLGDLARANLVTEHVPGRYTLHDLLRAYAAELAHARDNHTEREAATGRVLDHYLHTAAGAARVLNPSREPITLRPPRPRALVCLHPDYAHAMAWFQAEHRVLLAAVGLAADTGNDSHAWQLPWAMGSFLSLSGHWHEAADTQRTALAAATRLGDTAAQALTCRLLANACTNLGDHEQARRHYASSLTLHQQLGNRRGEARVHQNLGVLAERQGRYAEALDHCERALRLYQEMGDKTGEAETLNEMGWYHAMLRDYQRAREFCRRSLTLCAEVGHRWKEGNAWDTLGYAEHHLGNLAEAAACYQRALSLFRRVGFRFEEADTLTRLGDTRQTAGDLSQALENWRQALSILEDLQHPSAEGLRAKLRQAVATATRNCPRAAR